jgi:hypothetical protein
MMRLTAILFAAIFFSLGRAAAQEQDALRIDVFEYGLYERGEVVGEFAPPNQGFHHQAVASIRHLETTRIVPGRLGVAFGVRYRLEGGGIGFSVPVRLVIRFPPQGLYNPEYDEPLHVDVIEKFETLGDDNFNLMNFDHPWEIEPGIWTIEFWSGDTKLGEEQFEVITPPVS